MKIAHIINPIKVSENNDLYNAQPITFESMRVAKNFSSFKDNITLCTTQFEEDLSVIPNYFNLLSNLERSVLDIDPALKGRKLPLIKNILEKLKETDAEYYIYTNVDIALMPQFYDLVYSYIKRGHDAIVINRRRLSKEYKSIEDLPLMYSDLGRSHPGFDCFIFHKDLLSKLVLENICIGVPFIEVTLLHNLFSFAQNPILIEDAHASFHIGMDVLAFRKDAFYDHNRNEFFKKIQPKIKQYYSIKKFPYGTLPVHKRMIKWILNPSIFTGNYLNLEGKNTLQKIKMYLDEVRWRILQR